MRYSFAAGLLALGLAACSGAPDAVDDSVTDSETSAPVETEAPAPTPLALSEAVNGAWRDATARDRDAWRHPAETLEFFGIEPSGSVMEVWPGGGWYTDILAPWIHSHGGQYYAAWSPISPDNERAQAFQASFLSKFDDPAYGDVELVEFGRDIAAIAPADTLDAIVTFRNVHNWMGGGYAEKAFEDFYAVLKPGGVLGLVTHRQLADQIQDPRASTGYVQQDYVVALAVEAGFELVAESEINANPNDTADHPFGVWMLDPIGRTAPRGEPANPDFDRSEFAAIGESDRMTLLFRKPVGAE